MPPNPRLLIAKPGLFVFFSPFSPESRFPTVNFSITDGTICFCVNPAVESRCAGVRNGGNAHSSCTFAQKSAVEMLNVPAWSQGAWGLDPLLVLIVLV